MAESLFDFCTTSRVATLIPPDDPEIKDFNGWVYNPTPVLPFVPTFNIRLGGLKWFLNEAGTALDTASDPTHNAGRLEAFYRTHRLHKPFNFQHEYLGNIEMRFFSKVSIPEAIPNSGGAIDELEITTIQHKMTYD